MCFFFRAIINGKVIEREANSQFSIELYDCDFLRPFANQEYKGVRADTRIYFGFTWPISLYKYEYKTLIFPLRPSAKIKKFL